MTVRAVEWKKPYTWGKAIEITEDKVINLKLRAENNLIIYDEWDNEIYVDLQLPDEIQPTDAFPVWITTGRVIVDNWWDYNGTIVCFKTTSGDNIKLYYADDGKLYIDNWTGLFKQIYLKGEVDALLLALRQYVDQQLALKQDKFYTISSTAPQNPSQWDEWYDTTTNKLKTYDWTQWNEMWEWNTKTFRLASTTDDDNILAIGRYSYAWGNPIIIFWNQTYVKDSVSWDTTTYRCSEVDMTPDNLTWLTVVSQKLLNVSYSKTTWPWGYDAEMYGCTTGTDTIGTIGWWSGDVQVSTQANNILTSWMKIWAGEETDYANLSTYDSNTLYLTVPDSTPL